MVIPDRRSRPVRSLIVAIAATTAAAQLGGCAARITDTSSHDASGPASGDTSPSSSTPPPENVPAGKGLVWSDEFDGPSGSPSSLWKRMEGAAGWGNEELQNYTDSDENSFVADGVLHVVARHETTTDALGNSSDYTSARLMSYDAFRYGRVEARIQVPAGSGLWSAFWLFGTFGPGTTWPGNSELDVMEYVDLSRELNSALNGATVDGTLWSWAAARPVDADFARAWHSYTLDWTPEAVTYSVDGQELGTLRKRDLEEGQRWSFDNPAHIIMNVAVGGRWPNPDIDEAAFPADYLVDYVRVYDAEVHHVPDSWLPAPPP